MSSQVTDTVSQVGVDTATEFSRKLQAFISEEAHTLLRIEAAKRKCSNGAAIDQILKEYLGANHAS